MKVTEAPFIKEIKSTLNKQDNPSELNQFN